MKIQAQPGDRPLSHFVAANGGFSPYTEIKHEGITKLIMKMSEEVDMESNTVDRSLLEGLSRREREVLRFVAEGKSSREIAEEFLLSSKTVDTYRSRLMRKIKVKNVSGLIKFAIQHKIIKLE
jgi:DNA-binding NarL/FixJ family response regulator